METNLPMLFTRVNLYRELSREKVLGEKLLREVDTILIQDRETDNEIVDRLKTGVIAGNKSFPIPPDDSERIFSLETIRTVCLRYRLRFLDSSLFRPEYPYGAIAEIKSFEKKYGKKLHSFNIMAPAEAFELENVNKDPLLFAQLSNNSFYLLHQWGHELSWHRKFLSWPLRSLRNLLIFLFFSGALFAFLLPVDVLNVFNLRSEMYLRIWLAFHTFIGLFGLAVWAGFSFNVSLSEGNWDSKYYN